MGIIRKITHGIAWRVRRWKRRAYRVATEKHIYPALYNRVAKKYPADPKKVVFLEMRMPHLTENFRLLYDALGQKGGYKRVVCSIGAGLEPREVQYQNSKAALREMATAGIVFINDSSALLSCLALRKETTVIQVWHACGAFKKFGYSTADKIFGANQKELEMFPLHKNFSYVTVSSPEVSWAYAQAFHMEDRPEAFVATGISRTDIFYDKRAIDAAHEKLHRVLPQAHGKKIILYAPTFRGRVASAKSPEELDIAYMRRTLGDAYFLVCKHHPFVKNPPVIPEELADFAADVTKDLTIEELLMVSDICITDYSSLIFEYSLFGRPMAFFAYDLEEYYDWRGFFYDYDEMAPGPICKTTGEIIRYIRDIDTAFDRKRVEDFREKFMSACDGHATERILEQLVYR